MAQSSVAERPEVWSTKCSWAVGVGSEKVGALLLLSGMVLSIYEAAGRERAGCRVPLV